MSEDNLEKKIFHGGTIISMAKEHPLLEAIGLEGEKIIAVGNLKDVKTLIGDGYDLIDLEGKTLVPGFIDCHMHPISFMLLLLNLDLSRIKSLKELANADLLDLKKLWKNQRSWTVAKAIAAFLSKGSSF